MNTAFYTSHLKSTWLRHTLHISYEETSLMYFEHLNFDAVVKKFPQVFVFVCGILREEASILFAQIGEKLKSEWNWLKCSNAAENFFFKSWSESGNAERMANTLCSFIPFPRVVHLSFPIDVNLYGPKSGDWILLSFLLFCRRFSKVAAPDEIHIKGSLEIGFLSPDSILPGIALRELASLPNLKSLDFFR